MPQFKYVGEGPRVYPSLSLEVEPGDLVDLKKNPDAARFEPVVKADKAVTKKEAAK